MAVVPDLWIGCPRGHLPMPRTHDSDSQGGGSGAPARRSWPRRAGMVRPPRPPDTCVEEAVCDAVFRYQLQQPLADAPRPLCYYVARQGRDPGRALLGPAEALACHGP